ncbi:uncharacterized protein PG986_005147 [Apiospora aurea]|uniref:Uncharacterized protein n=1 Tax=Apiospora aurea TaxID=335848 RepID=A0ABR1QGQ4_9PEZI
MDEAKPLHMIGFRMKHGFQKALSLLTFKGARCRLGDLDNPDLKRIALVMLNLVIVAREAHRDWFYPGENCPFHIAYEFQLIDRRARVRMALWAMNYAINTMISEASLRELLRIILTGMAITSSLCALKGFLCLWSRAHKLAKQEVIENFWRGLQGVNMVTILNRNTTTDEYLEANGFVHDPNPLKSNYDHVDWNLVRGGS